MPHFDYHFRYALITYSQCGDLSPERVGERFQELGALLVIGRENHADGGIHLHCFVDFGRKEGSEELLASMLTVVTPILSSLEEHRKRATTMQLKMETSSSEALTDPHRAEAEIARLLLSGLRLRQQAIENRFGIWYINWIQKVRQLISPNFKSTVTGSLHLSLPSMSPLGTLSSLEEMLMDEIAGYFKLASDVDKHE